MIVALLVAAIGFVLAGLLGIVFGLPVKEFSFGNTLILAGAVITCTGMILLGLWTVVRELRAIAQRLESGEAVMPRAGLPADTNPALREPENDVFPFGRDQPGRAGPTDAEPATRPPWHEETATRDRARSDSPPLPGLPAEPEAEAKPRRNLLFSSTSRKERERAELRVSDPPLVAPRSSPAAGSPPSKSSEPPAGSENTWPHREGGRAIDAPPPRRSGRTPSTFTEANAGATGTDRPLSAARNEDSSAVSVLKSGVVDGMAYSLYSDGSIEAQMPEGMMRFASIDELRAHLDQRS
jgi:hypothetical protein